MSNWAYAQKVPTHPWRSAMTIPRELSLLQNQDDYVLKSTPVKELAGIESLLVPDKMDTDSGTFFFSFGHEQLMASHIGVKAGVKDSEQIVLKLTNKAGQVLIAGFDAGTGELWLDRRKTGISDFDTVFASEVHRVTTGKGFNNISLDLYIDRCSAELFFNGGMYVITDLIFPEESFNSVNVSSSAGNANGVEMKVWTVKGSGIRDQGSGIRDQGSVIGNQ
jgi:sucrose-6-phosphate hydrolase SacC (GH32 family)